MTRLRIVLAVLAALAGLLGAAAAVASGPLERQAGPYALALGYETEPVHQEEANAIVLRVVDTRTGEGVAGLENVLRLHLTIDLVSITRGFDLPFLVTKQPGVYRAVLIPPIAARYTYHLTGSIRGTPVDETYLSAEDGSGVLPLVTVRTDFDYSEGGAQFAILILVAYLVGLAVILALMARRRWARRRPGATAV